MNIDDYEKKYFSTYEAFAETVQHILKEALLATDDLPRPQSIQCRAKEVDSLRRRLAEVDKIDTQTLELDRRDLAGARLIFYTNNDVDRLLNSSLIRDNFEIEEDSFKIHHPIPENKGIRYRAIHYTVQLLDDRVRLPEYAKFAGMRCEIQVQTILNHAWSETSHDIIYKDNLGDGYGEKTMKGIARRFERVMDEYLIPAGFEIQKAQLEYEQVLQGKELFDKDIANLLDNAKNNNDRYEILIGLRDYSIPNYDNPTAAYKGLKDPLLRVVKAARNTEPVSIETTYGNMKGFETNTITKLVVEIVENLRYADVIGTLQLLTQIYRNEQSENIQQQILNVVKILSEYNINAYKQVGPMIQMSLVDQLDSMSDEEVDSIRPIALTVWTEAVQSNITGTELKADSFVVSTGAVPASDQLTEIRNKAINALFSAYDRSIDDVQKRAVLSALNCATRAPIQAQYSNEFLAITLKDAARIIDFVTERAKTMSYELLQHLEHQFLYDYFRADSLTKDPENLRDCQAEAAMLVTTIFKFRDTANADNLFVRYKILVGFESVYPSHWTDENFDYEGADQYRHEEANRYINEINDTNEDDWFDLVSRCAETKSNDLATFPFFVNFITKLAQRKPEVADRFLSKATDDLRNFLAGFLNGLALCSRQDIYERVLENELESASSLAGIVLHLRHSDSNNPDFTARLLKRATDKDDSIAVTECLLFVLEHYGTDKIADEDTFLQDALTFLNDKKDSRWVSKAWFLKNTTDFYEEMNPDRMTQIFENLGYLRQVNYEVDRILVQLAKREPEAVWDYLGIRLTREPMESEDEEHFEAVPFQFYGLEKELSKDPQLAISKGLSWFTQDQKLFQFRGGRLLSNTFPKCTPEFAVSLADLVKSGGDTEADFALMILQNYCGETTTHIVLKEVVSRFPDDDRKMSGVQVGIDSTGVVSGSLGFAEAYRTKRESLAEWLTDERAAVRSFAESHIAELDRMIASEHRRAEVEMEMRNRSYGDENDQ